MTDYPLTSPMPGPPTSQEVADHASSGVRPSVRSGSAVSQPPKQPDGLAKQLLLILREPIGDRLGEPPLALTPVGCQDHSAGIGELDQGPSAISCIGSSRDQPLGLELGDRLSHRLGADPFCGREFADAPWPLAVKAPQDSAVGKRETVLGAQPAHQLAEDDTKVAGESSRIGGAGPHPGLDR